MVHVQNWYNCFYGGPLFLATKFSPDQFGNSVLFVQFGNKRKRERNTRGGDFFLYVLVARFFLFLFFESNIDGAFRKNMGILHICQYNVALLKVCLLCSECRSSSMFRSFGDSPFNNSTKAFWFHFTESALLLFWCFGNSIFKERVIVVRPWIQRESDQNVLSSWWVEPDLEANMVSFRETKSIEKIVNKYQIA